MVDSPYLEDLEPAEPKTAADAPLPPPPPTTGVFDGEIKVTPYAIPEYHDTNQRKRLMILAAAGVGVVVVCLALLAWWRNGIGGPDSTTGDPNAVVDSGNAVTPWTVNDGGGNTTKLVVWNLFDAAEVFQPMLDEYKAERAAQGVTVEVEYHKFNNVDEYEKLLVNELAAGRGPDVWAIKNTWMTKHQDKIAPLPPDNDGPDGPLTVEKFKNIFVQAPVQDLINYQASNGPQILALPLSVDSLALFYNAKRFRDYVLVDQKPATYWDSLASQAEKLNKADASAERFAMTGIAFGRADNISRAVDIISMLILQKGGKLSTEDQTQATWEADKVVAEAVNFYANFNNNLYNKTATQLMKTGVERDEKEVNLFAMGKVGMMVGYSYYYDLIKNSIERKTANGQPHMVLSDVAVVPIPQFSKDSNVTLASYYPLTVSRNATDPAEAWRLVLFLAGRDNAAHYFSLTKKPPARQDLISEESQEPIYGVFAQQASYAQSLSPVDDGQYATIIKELVTNITDGNQTTEEALKLAQDRYQCLLDKKQAKAGSLERDCLSTTTNQ